MQKIRSGHCDAATVKDTHVTTGVRVHFFVLRSHFYGVDIPEAQCLQVTTSVRFISVLPLVFLPSASPFCETIV